MTAHIPYNELKSQIENSSTLHIFRENEGEQLILTEGRKNHSTRPIKQGDRIVSIGVAEHGAPEGQNIWFPIAANEYLERGDYGPNEVEWSALSVDEAVGLAKHAFNHEDYDEQPTVE